MTGEEWAAMTALAWRPAWSMRNRVGCLAPIIAWVGERLRRRGTDSAGSPNRVGVSVEARSTEKP
jgi:hypothetical protein